MLNVPSEGSQFTPKPPDEPKPVPRAKAPSLEEVGNLAMQVRNAHGEDSQLVEVDGELKVIHPESAKPASAQPTTATPKAGGGSAATGIGLALLIAIGAGVAWYKRDLFLGHGPRDPHYHPASLKDAHKYLAKHSGDPLLKYANQPKRKAADPIPDLNLPFPSQSSESPGAPAAFSGDLSPMPPPMQGKIPDTLPNPDSALKQPDLKATSAAAPDLHGLEARLRTRISANGGRVSRVREGSNFKTFYVSVSTGRAQTLASRIESEFSGNVTVSSPSEDEDEAQGVDDVKAAEIKAAESSVANLKKQMDQDEISFLPEAPALKSIRAQYTQALSDLSKLRKEAHPDSILRVTLSGN